MEYKGFAGGGGAVISWVNATSQLKFPISIKNLLLIYLFIYLFYICHSK